ncbi:NAD(P)H-binding protein [Novipirellula artificiosorum]|uniref:NAD(P)-binding domain-containing protein n=1 Tax=Novipirellula artificiosorum TaxID=2528016 RepID=A0A5C6D5V0_9BACT|nr:NAD(P)H-binding protein [Novipirellula artificiosorum]TWU32208.1 hypothetical protein Poly41_56930 [Novipirellula artificiosorum]
MVTFNTLSVDQASYAQPFRGNFRGGDKMVDREVVSILGADCPIGKQIVDVSLRCGYQVQALTQGKIGRSPNEYLSVLKSDCFAARDIQAVVRGSSCVINLCNVSGYDGSKERPTSTTVTKFALQAMQKTKANRYLLVTHQCVAIPGDRKLRPNGIVSRYLWPLAHRAQWKEMQAEADLLIQTPIDWTIVRCPPIKNIVGFGPVRTDHRSPVGRFVSLNRLARFLVHLKDCDHYRQKAIFVASRPTRSQFAM